MKEFFKEIEEKIEEAVKKDMQKILKEIGDEQIYAAALVTNSDCITLFLALNTYEYMRKKDLEYVGMFGNHLSEETIQKAKSGTSSITKWIPDEWGYSDGRASALSGISSLLYAKEEEDSDKYAQNNDLFFDAVTAAFKNLIASRVFGENSGEITYFISMSDDERTPEIENYSAKLLNPENVYEDFLDRKYDM